MSFERIVEDQIRKAIADGEFENLRGKGGALELESYFQTPVPLRLAYSMLKSAEFVPEEVRLMQEIAEAKQELSSCTDKQRATSLEREIQEKHLGLTVLLERSQRRKR
jgi:Domain of unknown function (DUF1992)